VLRNAIRCNLREASALTKHRLSARKVEAEVAAKAKAGYTLTVVSGYTANGIDYYAVILEKKRKRQRGGRGSPGIG
jgi:hypothetical protein